MHVFTSLCLVQSRYSTCSAPLPVICTILLLHRTPRFYAVVVFVYKIYIPGGARGLLLKTNGPSIAVLANIVGSYWQGINIFKVIVACRMRQHKICMGN